MIVSTASGPLTLAEWVAGFVPPQDSLQASGLSEAGLKRFVFYARASTAEHQDPWTSRAWQFDVASRLVQGHGVIVAEVVRLSPKTGHRISYHEGETLTIADTDFVWSAVVECRM